MKKFNRELLVLINEKSSPKGFESTVEQLHHLLYVVETSNNLFLAHEVININKRKIYRKRHHVISILDKAELKPFVFLCNLN